MKKDLHPQYDLCSVICNCGNTFVTRSTQKEIRVEICSKCHPFYTGQHRYVDSAGRIERFLNRYKTYQISST